MQIICREYSLGIKIDQVVLQDVNPPEPVKAAFYAVNEAQQEKETLINQAKSEYNKTKQEINIEVQETYFKYKRALLQMSVAESKVDYQSRQVDFTEAKRELKEAGASSVLEELVKLGEEQYSLLQAISDYFIAIKSLNKAIGIIGYF